MNTIEELNKRIDYLEEDIRKLLDRIALKDKKINLYQKQTETAKLLIVAKEETIRLCAIRIQDLEIRYKGMEEIAYHASNHIQDLEQRIATLLDSIRDLERKVSEQTQDIERLESELMYEKSKNKDWDSKEISDH